MNTIEKETILIVEDDRYLARDLDALLTQAGYKVIIAESAEQARRLLDHSHISLFLVDVWLPDGDGMDLLKTVRGKSQSPVLFLTACDDESSVVRGLDLGADDYITKPFRKAELISRIQANLRRVSLGAKQEQLISGSLSLDLAGHHAYLDGTELRLRPIEYRLLATFMQNPGLLLSRDRLAEILLSDFAEDAMDDNALSVHISRLRGKVGSEYIETVRGFGYRFSKPVKI